MITDLFITIIIFRLIKKILNYNMDFNKTTIYTIKKYYIIKRE